MEKMKANSQKGITIVALVITIILLLILAGVTINMVLGDEGIITRAVNAKSKQEQEDDKEQIRMAYTTTVVEEKGKAINNIRMEEYLKKKLEKIQK